MDQESDKYFTSSAGKSQAEANITSLAEAMKEGAHAYQGLSPELQKQFATLIHQRGRADELVHDQPLTAEKSLAPDHPEQGIYGMSAALDALQYAIKNNQKIGIYGDYDADGNTATAQWVSYLKSAGVEMNAEAQTYINSRSQGYGMSDEGLQNLKDNGVETLICVDMGTHSAEHIKKAQEMGMQVIVFDHHEVGAHSHLPEGAILCNPKHPDDKSGQEDLSAASLVYTALHHLEQREQRIEEDKREALFDNLAAISSLGVVPDVVSLQNKANRYITQRGTQALNQSVNKGAEYLRQLIGVDEVSSESLGFSLGPALNAPSRMALEAPAGKKGDQDLAMRLLVKQTEWELEGNETAKRTIEKEADRLAKKAKSYNEMRKELSNSIYYPIAAQKAEAFITSYRAEHDGAFPPALPIVFDEEMQADVRGIVASRLKETYNVPVVMMEPQQRGNETIYKMSGRSIEGVDLNALLVEPLKAQKPDGLLGIGGHHAAFGASITEGFKDTFIQTLLDNVQETLREVQSRQQRLYDIELENLDQLKPEFMAAIESLGPFGMGNPRPRVLLRDVRITRVNEMSDGKHLSLTINPADDVSSEASLRGGLAFFADGSPIADYINQGSDADAKPSDRYYNKKTDLLIEPFMHTHEGEARIGYHVRDVGAARSLETGEPELNYVNLVKETKARFKQQQQKAPKKIRYKLNDFLENPNDRAAQEVLRIAHQTRSAFYDLETGGLDTAHLDPERTNPITQISAIKPIQVSDNKYRLKQFDRFTTPENPLFFEYQFLQKKGQKCDYDQQRYEYVVQPKAFGVTGTHYQRDERLGPVTSMTVGGEEVESTPLFEAIADFIEFADESYLVGFNNAQFDNPSFVRQFWDIMAPLLTAPGVGENYKSELESIGLKIPPKLNESIYQFSPEAAESGVLDAYAEAIKFDKIIASLRKRAPLFQNIDAEPDTSPNPLEDIDNSAHMIDIRIINLMLFGDGLSRRLDDFSFLISSNLDRDDSKHDAIEDTVALLPFLKEYRDYALKRGWDQMSTCRAVQGFLSNRLPDVADIWEFAIKELDPGATVTVLQEVESTYKNEPDRIKNRVNGRIQIQFSEGFEQNPHAQQAWRFLETMGTVKQRNPDNNTNVLTADLQNRTITLNSKSSFDKKKIKHFSVLSKFQVGNRLLQEGIIEDITFFDSTAQVDIRIKDHDEAVESIPMGSFRKSQPYLQHIKEPQEMANALRILQWTTNVPTSSLAALDKDEEGNLLLTLKGTQRGFGDVVIDLGKGPIEEQIRALEQWGEHLSSLGNMPEGEKSEREMENPVKAALADMLEDGEVDRVRLPVGGREFAMVVSSRLYETAAQHHNLRAEADDKWPSVTREDQVNLGSIGSGIQVTRIKRTSARDHDRYVLTGNQHVFAEIQNELGGAAYLIHRLNTLPGVGKVTLKDHHAELMFEPVPSIDTMYILLNSHIPFSVSTDYKEMHGRMQPVATLRIRLDDKLSDAYYYNRKLKDEKKRWSDQKRKVGTNAQFSAIIDHVKESSEYPEDLKVKALPEKEWHNFAKAAYLQRQLALENLTEIQCDNQGIPTVSTMNGIAYRLAENENKGYSLTYNQFGEIKPKNSTVVVPKQVEGMDVVELRPRICQVFGQLSRLPMIQGEELSVEANDNGQRVSIKFPKLDILPPDIAQELQAAFTEISHTNQTRYIHDAMKKMQALAASPATNMSHYSDEEECSSKVKALSDGIIGNTQSMLPLLRDICEIADKSYYDGYKSSLFMTIQKMVTLRETVEGLQKRSQPHHEDYKKRAAFLKDYSRLIEGLTIAEHKRHQIAQDGLEMLKLALPAIGLYAFHRQGEMHRDQHQELVDMVEAIQERFREYNLYPSTTKQSAEETLDKLIKKASRKFAGTANHYQHQQLVKINDDLLKMGKKFSRSLHKGMDEIIKTATMLKHREGHRPIHRMAKHVESAVLQEAKKHLNQLERANDSVKHIAIDEDNRQVHFDATELLKKPKQAKNTLRALLSDRGTGKPFEIVDTTVLINFLTGMQDVKGSDDVGYLHLYTELIKQKAMDFVLTDMVLAEFLDVYAPLTAEDIFLMDENGKATGIKAEILNKKDKKGHDFPAYEERLQWLKDVYNAGAIFLPTRMGEEYLKTLQQNPNLAKSSKLQSTWEKAYHAKEVSSETLPEASILEIKKLLLGESELGKKFAETARRTKLRKHSGEMSLAYAQDHFQQAYGHNIPILIAGEGSDVFSLMNQTYHRADNAYITKEAERGKVQKQYKLGSSKMEQDKAKEMGNVGYHSGSEFLADVATVFGAENQERKAQQKLSVFLMDPKEVSAINDNWDQPYDHILYHATADAQRISGQRTSRMTQSYHRFHDFHVSDMGKRSAPSPYFRKIGESRRDWEKRVPAEDRWIVSNYSERFTGVEGPLKQWFDRLEPDMRKELVDAHIEYMERYEKAKAKESRHNYWERVKNENHPDSHIVPSSRHSLTKKGWPNYTIKKHKTIQDQIREKETIKSAIEELEQVQDPRTGYSEQQIEQETQKILKTLTPYQRQKIKEKTKHYLHFAESDTAPGASHLR